MTLRYGSMRHRVTILRLPDPSDVDEAHQPVDQLVEVGRRWAEVLELTGNRLWAAQQVHAEARTEVRLHWTDEIKPLMRIRHMGQDMEIISAADPDGKRKELVCICRDVTP